MSFHPELTEPSYMGDPVKTKQKKSFHCFHIKDGGNMV